jgi:hypothetical protein
MRLIKKMNIIQAPRNDVEKKLLAMTWKKAPRNDVEKGSPQ